MFSSANINGKEMDKINIFVQRIVFYVNGKRIEDNEVNPEWTLLEYLRNKLQLCGTKLGCGEGGCGACTVMLSKYDRSKNKIMYPFIRNLININIYNKNKLPPICSMHGLAVTTVEGIGSTKTKLHPVQERIAKAHGSQCGFCTPGIVMSMYTLLRNSPKPNMEELEVAFQGNLCRCTGYRPIIEGYRTFTEEWDLIQQKQQVNNVKINGNFPCGMGNKCCKLQNGTTSDEEEVLFKPSEFTPYDASQEPIFPPELKLSDKYDKEYVLIKSENVTWYRPTKFEELLNLKQQFPDAKLLVGNTEIGVEVKFKNMSYPVIIQASIIKELTKITITDKGVKVGAATTLTDMEIYLQQQIKILPEYKTRVFKAIVKMLNWFAGKQIRSVGAIGSNIMTGSPISDMIPIFMANNVELEVTSKSGGTRKVLLDDNFFTGYRKTVVKPDEILLSILLPYTIEYQYFYAYKQARRRNDDIAIVNAAINVTFEPKTNMILKILLAFGGMSFKCVMAPKTQATLIGLPWNSNTLEKAHDCLLEDLPLSPDAPGGMIQYRRSLPLSIFFKAYLTITEKLQTYVPDMKLDPREVSGIHEFLPKELKSSQCFTVVPNTQEKHDTLQRPIIHTSAFKQATGEAIYCDDMPKFKDELYLAFVYSTKAHAKILKIDPSNALAIEGVHDFISAKDIAPEKNEIDVVEKDERIFYYDVVTAEGQIIGAIVADNKITAKRAAKLVRVDYEELEPVIITIEDAIKHDSYFSVHINNITKGDIDKVLNEAPHVLENECRVGGQEHFYLETQVCLCVPKKEDDEMDVYLAAHYPSAIAELIADVLGVQRNKIIAKVKRLGGGFGGKEWTAVIIALPTAVAAAKLNRPVRIMLDRDEDMMATGGRHPFYIKYKVGFDYNGKILGCDVKLYNNGGHCLEMSRAVLERAMRHFANAYNIPVIRIKGYPCKTNLSSNNAFRGFGAPQGMFACESMIRNIAVYLNKDVTSISEVNLCKEGDNTVYNQQLINCTLMKCWRQVIDSSNYQERRKLTNEFNRNNRYKKRGICVVPTTFGVGFPADYLNQSGALILVYTDGSVLLSHGGVEMGQGIHTKMIQIATRVLGISADKIHISETGTDKVPNTSPTAGSTGSDLNGMAVIEACEKIKRRLKPYKEANPQASWEEWVSKAYFDRVSLSATGFFKTPDIGYDWEKKSGNLCNYFTYGAAVSEVEIDTLSGDHQVIRTDIVMDLGESLNPAIDVGQIEGAFMQGYGLFVMEELMYSPKGTMLTRGPGTYKLPGYSDIPAEFNVSLLKGVSNPRAVYSSKAVGEPPLFLASSIAFAIWDAIKAARAENSIKESFVFDAPATPARIRMACQDNITLKLQEPLTGSYTPWNVIP